MAGSCHPGYSLVPSNSMFGSRPNPGCAAPAGIPGTCPVLFRYHSFARTMMSARVVEGGAAAARAGGDATVDVTANPDTTTNNAARIIRSPEWVLVRGRLGSAPQRRTAL